jgi:DNA-binding GntR family transcriptional regulator
MLVKQAILDRGLSPGESLVETALADRFGVSRTPIREALQRLEQDGLVERGDRGLVVRDVSPEEILDIYEARIALEGTAARLAADRRTNLDIVQIRRQLAAMSEVEKRDELRMAETNRGFHAAVWLASHNPSLLDLFNRIDQHLARYPVTTLSHPGRWETAIAEHADLLDAIERRDGVNAEKLAVHHFTEARDIRLLQWENRIS